MKKYRLLFLSLLITLIFLLPAGVSVASAESGLAIRAGAYENPPKIFTNDNGEISGLFPDILEYIASKEGWEIEYIKGTWDECLQRLENNEIDIMVDVAYSEERAEKYDFNNETVFINWGVIYENEYNDIESVLDLEGKEVAIMKKSIHSSEERGIKKLTNDFDINCIYIEVDNYEQVFELLDRREADAGVVNRVFGSTFEEEYKVHNTNIIFNPSELRFAMPKNASLNQVLIEPIDRYLIAIKDDPNSIYYKAIEEHIERRALIDRMPGWVLPALLGAIGFVLFLFFTSYILREQVKARTAELQRSNDALEENELKLQRAMEGITEAIATTTEMRDPFTAGHQKRVGDLACAIAVEMNMSEDEINCIRVAADLHDIGKIQIPAEILCKPAHLTDVEYRIVKNHCQAGYEILKSIDFPWPISQIVLQHHERINGSGYPSGLAGENILLQAKILGVADVAEAMSSHRPYRPALETKEMIEELSKNKGILYDAEIAEICVKLFTENRFHFEQQ